MLALLVMGERYLLPGKTLKLTMILQYHMRYTGIINGAYKKYRSFPMQYARRYMASMR